MHEIDWTQNTVLVGIYTPDNTGSLLDEMESKLTKWLLPFMYALNHSQRDLLCPCTMMSVVTSNHCFSSKVDEVAGCALIFGQEYHSLCDNTEQ